MEKEICRALARYIDCYQWRWNLAGRVINRYFGTAYTEKQLKKLYQRGLDEMGHLHRRYAHPQGGGLL